MYGMNGWNKEIPGGDLISRAAVLEELADLYWTEERFLTFKDVDGVFDRIKALPSAQPEPLTDKEQRIFLAAMDREEKVCEEVDRNYGREPYKDSLAQVCKEIRRKVKGALWT